MVINKSKYSFRRYKFWYKFLFEKEKRKLNKIFSSAKIEHIGSTSIKGLGGKGIIDLLLGLDRENWKAAKDILLQNGYLPMENASDRDRISLKKDYSFLFRKRRVHVHLTFVNSINWRETLKFKENLSKNKRLVEQYEKIKKEAVKKARGDGAIYRKHKSKFIKKYSK